MRIPLPTDLTTRDGTTLKDAKLVNSFVDGENVFKRPISRGGIVIAAGIAQGGIGITVDGVQKVVTFFGDTQTTSADSAGTTWSAGTNYSKGDHTTSGWQDYWAVDDNIGNNPTSSPAHWSTTYVPPAPHVIVYATWNPADQVGVTLSNGNLTAFTSHGGVRSTIGKSSGKWYWEYAVTANNNYDGTTIQTFGVATLTSFLGNEVGNDAGGWGYGNDLLGSSGIKRNNSTDIVYGALLPITSPATFNIGVALDMTAGTLTFYKNGVSQGIAYSGLTGTLYAEVGMQTADIGVNISVIANFGATAFTYSVPAGYNSGLYV